MNNYFIIKPKEKIENAKNLEENKKDLLINRIHKDKVGIHSDIYNKMKNSIDLDDNKYLMNTYIYGPSGSGKMSIARYAIEYYTENKVILDEKKFSIDNKEVIYYKGKYHYELIINKYNFNDLNVIIGFLNNIVYKDKGHFSIKSNIILFKNIYFLKNEILILLKNYIEKYNEYNSFIFISNKFPPKEFNGFFQNIRVPSPNSEDLKKLGKEYCKDFKIKYKENEIEEIVSLSNRSFTRFRHIFEISYLDGSYEKYIDSDNDKLKFLYKILKKKKVNTLILIRDLINELLIDNVDETFILKYIMNNVRNDLKKSKIEETKAFEIINKIIKCNHNISMSFRPIHHLEYLLVSIMNII